MRPQGAPDGRAAGENGTGKFRIGADQDAGAATFVEPSVVRPYAWTRGRTAPGRDLAIEALVSTSRSGRDRTAQLQWEHHEIAVLCEETRSVAEIAALIGVPLGVARILLGDMVALGLVTVHRAPSDDGAAPDVALLERVLIGLQRL